MRLQPDIFSAARHGQLDVLRLLLRPEAEVSVDLRNDFGVTALMLAAEAGQDEAVSLLLEHGAQVGVQDCESGYSALHRACFRGQLGAAAILVRVGGASVDGPFDREGLSPLALLQMVHGPPASPADAPVSGDVYTWGQAGCLPLGRPAGTASLESKPARAKLPAAPSSLEEHACEEAAARAETADPRGLSRVAAAKHHTLFADAAGSLFSCGLGVGGRLGHGDESALPLPRLVRLAPGRRVSGIAAALDHSFAVTCCGELWAWGAGRAPLGFEPPSAGDMGSVLSPRRVMFGGKERVLTVDISTSNHHAVSADRAGCVWSWGDNARGQCGQPSAVTLDRRPRRVDALTGCAVATVAAGEAHSAAVGVDGKLWCWGHDVAAPQRVKLPVEEPPHGMRSHHRRRKPAAVQVVCGASHTAGCSTSGAIYVWNAELRPRLVRVGGGLQVVSLAASRYTIYAVTSGGLLYSWAEHWHANHTPRPHWHRDLRCVSQVAAAEQHCAALVAVRRPPVLPVGGMPGAPMDNATSEDEGEGAGAQAGPNEGAKEGVTACAEAGAGMGAEAAAQSARGAPRLGEKKSEDHAPGSPHVGGDDAGRGDEGGRVLSLKRLCERQVACAFTPRNVLDFLYAADAIVANDLAAAARAFVQHNMPLLLRKPLWTYLPPNVLAQLSSDLGGGAGRPAGRATHDEEEEEVSAGTAASGGFESPLMGGSGDPRQRARQLRKKLKQVEGLEKRPFGLLTAEQRAKVLSRTRLEYEIGEIMSAHPEILRDMETPLLSPAAPPASALALAPVDDAAGPSSSELTPATGPDTPFRGHNVVAPTRDAGVSMLGAAPVREPAGGGRTALRRRGLTDAPLPTAGGPLLQSLEAANTSISETDVCVEGQRSPIASTVPVVDPMREAMRSSISGWGYTPVGPPQGAPSTAAPKISHPGGGAPEVGGGSAAVVLANLAGSGATAGCAAGDGEPTWSACGRSTAPSLAQLMAEEQRAGEKANALERAALGKRRAAAPLLDVKAAAPIPSASVAAPAAPSFPILHFVKRATTPTKPPNDSGAAPLPAWGSTTKGFTLSGGTAWSPDGKPQPPRLTDILAGEALKRAPATPPATPTPAGSGSGSKGKGRPKYVPLSDLDKHVPLSDVEPPPPKPAWGGAASGGAPAPSSSGSAAYDLSPQVKPLALIFEEQAASDARRRDDAQAQSTRWGLLPESVPISLAAIQREETSKMAAEADAEAEAAELAAAIAAIEAAERAAVMVAGALSARTAERSLSDSNTKGSPAAGPSQSKTRQAKCKHFAAGARRKGSQCPYLHVAPDALPPSDATPQPKGALDSSQAGKPASGAPNKSGRPARKQASRASVEGGVEVSIRLTRAAGERWGVRLCGGQTELPVVEAVLEGGLAEGRLISDDILVSIGGQTRHGHAAATEALRVAVGEVEIIVRRSSALRGGAKEEQAGSCTAAAGAGCAEQSGAVGVKVGHAKPLKKPREARPPKGMLPAIVQASPQVLAASG
jgi:hypothetical protein